jgi:hypothetical protein
MKHTIRDTKTNEVLTISDREFNRIKDNPRYAVVENEKAPDVAPSAVSTVAGELAAPSGADSEVVSEPTPREVETAAEAEPAKEEAGAAHVEAAPSRKKNR